MAVFTEIILLISSHGHFITDKFSWQFHCMWYDFERGGGKQKEFLFLKDSQVYSCSQRALSFHLTKKKGRETHEPVWGSSSWELLRYISLNYQVLCVGGKWIYWNAKIYSTCYAKKCLWCNWNLVCYLPAPQNVLWSRLTFSVLRLSVFRLSAPNIIIIMITESLFRGINDF